MVEENTNNQFQDQNEAQNQNASNDSAQKGNETGNQQETKPEKKYSDEEVNKILDQKFAKWKAEEEKRQDEAKKFAEMNATEKADFERKKLEDEIKELKRKENIHEMSKTASSILSDKGITATDQILTLVVKETAEETNEAISTFVELVDKTAEIKTKQALTGKAPVLNVNPGKPTTKKEIMDIKNDEERQKAIRENLHLFK